MTFTFIIEGRLESLNQTLKIPKYRFAQSFRRQQMKRRVMQWIQYVGVPKFDKPVRIHFVWIEQDRRRDRDNIRAGAKIILDALVKLDRIRNDSQKWLLEITDSYDVDKHNPRIQVTISDA